MMEREVGFMGLLPDACFRSSLLSKLVDLALWDVQRENPRAPCKMVATLRSSLQKHANEYYQAVVQQFDQLLQSLRDHGAAVLDGQKVFFACPHKDGSMVELFPNGISVRVTAENYKCFLNLVSGMRQKVPARLRDLPIDPTLHLSGDYYPVACFIVDHLLNSNSEWYIDNEEDWNALNVTYCVPFNGQLLDVYPGMRDEPVPYCDAKRFGIGTKKSLQHLMKVSQPPIQSFSPSMGEVYPQLSMISRGYFDFLQALGRTNRPFGIPLSVEEFNAIGLTYSVPVGNTFVPLIPGRENERVAFEDKELFVMLATEKLMETMMPSGHTPNIPLPPHSLMDNTTPLEKRFWDIIETIKKDPAKAVGFCFAIRVLGHDVFLKERGDTIGVTEENVEEYLDLLYQKKEMIHAAFVQSEIQKMETQAMSFNNLSPSPEKVKESFKRYPPQNSPLWNTFTLDPEDANNEIFQIANTIPFSKDNMTQKEYGGPFFFAIPIVGKGLYKILPHGEGIPVTWSNHEEFLERVEYEKKRLDLRTSTACKQSLSAAEQENPVMGIPSYMRCQQRGAYHDPSLGSMRITTRATLDEIDMYKRNLLLLKRDKNRVSTQTFEDLGLRYTLTVAGEEVELVKDGRQQFVAVNELDSYIEMAICKLDELRLYILQQNEVYAHGSDLTGQQSQKRNNNFRQERTKGVTSTFSPQSCWVDVLSHANSTSLLHQ
ncbi:hypothetical protein, conserved [Trypanosoma cruzi]|uniref:Uncharacterized protein n=1 Tax=Trypanosoma cruzi (strain CL Brener) TaxID=353153 RepID=Q4DNT0_TRYCC|nr:hypothetical protein, conserved [Trypanosoma cruzi]EAN94198.1 hypothetical protein, conserved [Trypanosoma cruzi]|eukprot:XP_816049.1 hypothetical protein [Trypanosoma cruzi strain CL Brener]